ncbi:hypothetical protein [Bacillus cereus group sp. BfR-BA-01380]|uniref:hypothetical protein n=1 Tax=Bacillus cereus group sp. BfR-BA-01380 TaxID=2920324 RepID=UPI001F5A11F8|nr:hypothetical protein [Bacillus cereus group sp. BfR-BA-01380]
MPRPRGTKRPEILAARAGQQRNVEVARPECEGDRASDVEVFFTSQEEAKPPNILATGTGQCFR